MKWLHVPHSLPLDYNTFFKTSHHTFLNSLCPSINILGCSSELRTPLPVCPIRRLRSLDTLSSGCRVMDTGLSCLGYLWLKTLNSNETDELLLCVSRVSRKLMLAKSHNKTACHGGGEREFVGCAHRTG